LPSSQLSLLFLFGLMHPAEGGADRRISDFLTLTLTNAPGGDAKNH
jgi:hypothetical protein